MPRYSFGQITLRSETGLDATVAIHKDFSGVRILVRAEPSSVTEDFDREYRRAWQDFEARALEHGVSNAGDPPIMGAAVLMAEFEVIYLGHGDDLKNPLLYGAGTGSEWEKCWTWEVPVTTQKLDDFQVSSAVDAVILGVS